MHVLRAEESSPPFVLEESQDVERHLVKQKECQNGRAHRVDHC